MLIDERNRVIKERDKVEQFPHKLPSEKDRTSYFEYLELTSRGEPICLNEYAAEIALNDGVHVVLLDQNNTDEEWQQIKNN